LAQVHVNSVRANCDSDDVPEDTAVPGNQHNLLATWAYAVSHVSTARLQA